MDITGLKVKVLAGSHAFQRLSRGESASLPLPASRGCLHSSTFDCFQLVQFCLQPRAQQVLTPHWPLGGSRGFSTHGPREEAECFGLQLMQFPVWPLGGVRTQKPCLRFPEARTFGLLGWGDGSGMRWR